MLSVLGYNEFTGSFTTATSEATATTLATVTATFTGTEQLVFEFFCGNWSSDTTTTTSRIALFMDGTVIGTLWAGRVSVGSQQQGQIFRRGGRLTPSAGSHTFTARAYSSAAATFNVSGGDGVGNNESPCYLAVLDMAAASSPTGSVLEAVGYGEVEANVNVTSTSSASPDTVVSTAAFTLDSAATCWVEFNACAWAQDSTTAVGNLQLWDGATELGRLWRARAWATGSAKPGIRVRRRVSLASGSHTLSVKGYVSASSTLTIAGDVWPGTSVDQANHIQVFREVTPYVPALVPSSLNDRRTPRRRQMQRS